VIIAGQHKPYRLYLRFEALIPHSVKLKTR
jgi:hypothetical protein